VVPQACKEAAVGATSVLRRLAALLSGVLAASGARAVDLPEDTAEAMYHSYVGGGVTANGPALLVRKSLSDSVSLSGMYYVDSVSNASIDVVTTASPYHETRNEYTLGMDYVYRDSSISLTGTTSREPDYTANTTSLNVSQEVFGGMTTVTLGFTRGADTVLKHNSPEFHDTADHWQYRLGVSQILTKQWIMSANVEALADEGYLGSPYRVARVFGAAVPENDPRTRSGRAAMFRVIGDLGSHDSVHANYRYYWDTWNIKASTVELGYSRYFGDRWLADTYTRYYSQTHASFYSDNAQTQTTYVSRDRQLSTFDDIGLGAKLAYTVRKVPGQYELKFSGAYEYVRYKYNDFTDIRTGSLYGYNASILELYVTATF
jgi:hypothetical protein